MKKHFNLSSKCLAFFLALVMMISSFPLVALAAETDTHDHADTENHSEDNAPHTGVKFSDGVFTVTVDVNEIYGLIEGGSLSREAILDLVPVELKDAIRTDGDATAKAEALLRAYFNLMIDNDPERLYDSIPEDMLIRHFRENGYKVSSLKAIITSMDKAELVKHLSAFIIEYSMSLSINGKTVYHKDDPKLDVNLITQAMAESIPTFDKLAQDPNNVYAFVIDWELNQNKIDTDTTKTHYTFGIKVELEGNTDRLAGIFQKLASVISVVNEGDTTSVAIRVPAKVASLYLKAVNTDKLPEGLKAKVLHYSGMDITEDNVNSIIADFSVEEIASIIENVDFNRVPDVAEKLLDLYSDPYDRAVSMAKRAVAVMTYDKLIGVAERLGVEKLESGVENNEEKISELREKIINKIDKMDRDTLIAALKNHDFGNYDTLLADAVRSKADAFNLISDYAHKAISKAFAYAPDAIVGVKISDYYSGEGQFGPFTKSFGYDVGPKLEQLLGSSLAGDSADYAMNFLKNTEITRNVSFSVTFSDIYEARFIDKDGNTVFVTYLPVGADLSVVYGVSELEGYGKDWTYDGETAASVMPAMDVRLTVLDPEHVHGFVHVKTVEPTCTEGGYELWRCECQFEEQRNVTPALGHNVADEWEISYPTKHDTGMAVKKCTRCDEVCEKVILPVLPEKTDYFYVVTENSDGYCNEWTITYTFLLGDEKQTYTVGANANHVWGEWEVTKKPTIHDNGLEKNACEVCGYEIEREAPALESSLQELYHEETGVVISGIFANNIKYNVIVDPEVDYDADVWAEADGIEGVDRIKLMDISIADLSTDYYDYAEGLTVTIPIDPAYADRDFVVYHMLHDGKIEKFATNDESIDEKHRLSVVQINTITGTAPALRFKVYSFSEFLIGMVHVHEFGDWYVTDEPTTDKGGMLQRECTTGDEIHIETKELPKLNDVDYDYDYIAPECGKAGAHVYTYEYGGKTFTFTIDIAALEHSYGEWFVTKVPTEDGYGELKRTCKNDKTHEQVYMLPALSDEDFYVCEVVKPSTCTSTGIYKYTTKEKIDGQTFSFEVETSKLVHSFGEWVTTVEPKCEDVGLKVSTCSLCGEEKTEIIPALGHDYDDGKILPGDEPTCTEDGIKTFTCSRCGDKITEPVDALGHDYDEGKILPGDEPTCTEDGIKTFTCSRCGDKITESVDALGHSHGEWIETKAPTCTENGIKTSTCTRCGDALTDTIPALGHDYDKGTITKEPTCTEDGIRTFTCSRCGDKITESVDALGHSHGEWTETKAPTCTENGIKTSTCTRCGDTLTDTIPALGHDYDKGTVTKDPTCTEEGILTRKCSRCGDEITEPIGALGHDYDKGTVTKEPTCTEEGILTRKCSRCGDEITEPIDALGHDYDKGTVTKAPTCTEEGILTRKCSRCGDTITESIDATGHDYGKWTVKAGDMPTTEKEGKLTRVCANDPTHVETCVIPALNKTDYIHQVIVAPKCETSGKDKYTYKEVIDGQTFAFEVVTEPLGHDYDWKVTLAPTKNTTGILEGTCANGHVSVITLLSLSDYDYGTPEVIKKPMCEEKGTERYTYTTVDGQTVTFDVETAALGHDYEWKVILAPTKNTTGTLEGTCANGHVSVITLLSLNDYNYGTPEVIKAPTCEETGIDRYTYTTVDGQKVTFEVVTAATGHTYGEWTVLVGDEPTKDEVGKLTRVCACGDTDTHELPKLGTPNAYTVSIQDPTCTAMGYERYSYTHGGKTFEFTVSIPMVAHTYGEWMISYPTASATGALTKECTECGHTKTHTLPVLDDNNYDVAYKAPTCTENGYKKYTYSYMGETFEIAEFVLPAMGHSYGEWTITLAPTKETSGTLTRECECEYRETHTLPALNDLLYEYTLVAAATCTEAGSETYVYTHGEQSFTFTVELPAKGHAYGEWTVAIAPTTGAAGELQRTCANDTTHVEKQALPALNVNDYEYALVSAPLCEVSGTAKYSYTYGGKTFDFEVTLPALGHDYTEWTVSVAPTATTAGELVRTCKNNAEHKETKSVPSFADGADEYTYKVITEPTETEQGLAVYTYVFEGITFEFNVELPATGEAEPAPESGFPWWILLIIILVLLVIPAIVLLIILLIKRKNDKTPPPDPPIEPMAPIDESPIEEASAVVVPVGEADEEETETDVPDEQITALIVRKTAKRAGKIDIVNVGMLNANFSDGDTVSLEVLKEKGLIAKSAKRYKVLSDGELTKALTVKADECSPAARLKIMVAGGHIEKIRI